MYRNSMSVMLCFLLVGSYAGVDGEIGVELFFYFYKFPMSLEKHTIDHTIGMNVRKLEHILVAHMQ